MVDRVVRLHHDWYMSNPLNASSTKREDITLVVRNFNFPMPNAITSPTNPLVTFNPIVNAISNCSLQSGTLTNVETESTWSNNAVNTNETSSSSQDVDMSDMGLGPDQKITGYVDFEVYYKNLEIARINGTLPNDIDF